MTHNDDSNLVDSCMYSVNVVMIQGIPILLAFKGSIGLLIAYESFLKKPIYETATLKWITNSIS